jgi:hypothetical protein
MGKQRKVSDVLVDALAAIDEYGWTKDTLGSTSEGFCARGAIYHATGGGRLYGKAEGTLSRVIGGRSVPGWNDSMFRTKGQVRRAFRRAIDSARVEESIEAALRARRDAERAKQRAERGRQMERPVLVGVPWGVEYVEADDVHAFPLKR